MCTMHIGYVHGSKLEPFSPPKSVRIEEYLYYYNKGYRRITGEEYRQIKTAA